MRKILLLVMGMLLLCGQLLAQSRTVSGKVTDESGNPVPNASVTVKSSSIGTTTKADGTFSLSVPANTAALVISSVGMVTQEIRLGAGNEINISLRAASADLAEVIVVAYGTQKKVDITGVVATVKADDIENKPFTSVDKALQGQVAGLQSVASSGAPGAAQAIRIRGVSSITAGNNPLWVVDGIPVVTGDVSRLSTTANVLATMNPNDIESITVLKDAASQSIYGSRAANGVILVTTKKGKAGRTRMRADIEVGQSDLAYENDKYRPLNAQQYLDITREGLVNLGVSQGTIDATLAGLGNGNGVDFNWYDNVLRTGSQQQYNLSAEGGNEKTTFYISGGYFKQEGTTINSQLERKNGALRATHKATDRLTISANINGGFVSQRTPLAGGAFGNPVLTSYFLLPTRTAYNPDGSYNLQSSSLGGLHNTIALTEIDKRFLRALSLRGNVSLEYKILSNLSFTSSAGADYNSLEEDQYNNPLHGDGVTSGGRAFAYYTRYFNWNWVNMADYKYDFNSSGDTYFNFKVGYEVQNSRGYFSSVRSNGFPSTLLLTYPAVGATPITASATISDNIFVSLFSRANINYKDRYVLSGSFRRDGSSRFSPNNKYGNFWSVGFAWNVDREEFMQNVAVIDQLKLRGSYGVNGNAAIGNYDWQSLYGYGFNYNQQPGSAPSNVGDPNLTWELNKPFNVGIDISVLKSRINFSADYYVRKSEDLLLNVPLSRTSGFASATRNIGSMENKGIEITINAVPVTTRDFSWTIDFNFANNKNKVLSLPDDQDIIQGSFIIREGESIQSFYLRQYAGVDPANGDPLWYEDATKATTSNVYGSAERVVLGSSLPKYFGSFTNSFSYKGISLEAQLYYNFGNYLQDTWAGYYLGAGFGATFNKITRVLDRWQNPGDITDIPRYIYNGNKSFQSGSSFYLTKGDFIRLRNIQLGYKLPQTVVSKIKFSSVFFYVRGTNLWTWVKDDNIPFDPEQGTNSQTNLNVYIPKTVTVGLNLGF